MKEAQRNAEINELEAEADVQQQTLNDVRQRSFQTDKVDKEEAEVRWILTIDAL